MEAEYMANMLVVHHPDGTCAINGHNYDECMYHDDYPDAWAMAEDVYIDINGAPVRKKAPEVPSVPNVIQHALDKGSRRDPMRNRTKGGTSYE